MTAHPDPAAGRLVMVCVVVLTVHDGQLSVLLDDSEPGTGTADARPRLPSRLFAGDDLMVTAGQLLADTIGLDPFGVYLEQLGAFTSPARDDVGGQELTVAYLAITPAPPEPGPEDAVHAGWRPAHPCTAEPDRIAGEHHPVLTDGIARAVTMLEQTTLAARFCPEPFTMADLRKVYEAVWDTQLDPRNFHRKVNKTEGFVIPTGRKQASETGRPAELYHRGPATTLYPPMLRAGPPQ